MTFLRSFLIIFACLLSASVARAQYVGDDPYDDRHDVRNDEVYDDEVYDEDVDDYPSTEAAVGPFFDELAPYGDWIDANVIGYPELGWVWAPRRTLVGSNFRPYLSNGSWVASNAGWMFESRYPWGWVVFHYGRWARVPSSRYRWVWVPGTRWAPAWVDWREYDSYVGWAPRPPRGFHSDEQWWYFCGESYLGYRQLDRHLVPSYRRRYFYRRAAPLPLRDGYRWGYGPDYQRVVRRSSQPIVRVTVTPPDDGVFVRSTIRNRRVRMIRRGRLPSHVSRRIRRRARRRRRLSEDTQVIYRGRRAQRRRRRGGAIVTSPTTRAAPVSRTRRRRGRPAVVVGNNRQPVPAATRPGRRRRVVAPVAAIDRRERKKKKRKRPRSSSGSPPPPKKRRRVRAPSSN